MILSSLALTGCDKRVRIATPPVDLLTCDAMPRAPDLSALDGTPATQRARDVMMLGYVLALRSAYGSCAGNLAGVKAWAEVVE